MSQQHDWAPGGIPSLYLVGTLLFGVFAFATGQVGPESGQLLGFWILGISVPLLMLAMIDMRRGDVLFGTIGMVFGGVLGLGASLSFIRAMWLPGIFALDGWLFLATGIVFFLLVPSIQTVSKLMGLMFAEVGVAIIILGLGMIGIFGPPDLPLKITGWLVLIFALYCWYAATAQLVNTMYKKRVLPL